ncbi:hypothetical protein VTN96DRAFT_2533 [Rasamsonia emersonii]
MCGLTAILSFRNRPDSPAVTEKEIDDSLEIVKHRGPDARGQWISPDGRVGLGHVRLSIIDLSPDGNQPFHDRQNDVHAIVNGELYDHERYRADLYSEYDFQGRSDCEIVLALYRHYGLSFVSHLRGEFALVLWDAKRQVFLAARDRYGIKSLYYTFVDGRLLVATEMKSFLALGWQPEWCVQSLMDGGWRFDKRTLFKGVRKVLPGHYLLSKHFGDVEQRLYWDLEYPDKRVLETRSEAEMIAGVRKRLLQAVRLRLRADVPVGVYLSGGLDSSAIAGMVAHLLRESGAQLGNDDSRDLSRMQCFTVQFDKDSGADESDIAQRTAEWLGVDFHPVHLDEAAMAARFEDVVWYSETPTADVNAMGKLALSEVVHSKGFKVVITGEGSDEHFGGYSLLCADALAEPDYSWPASILSEFARGEAWRAARAKVDIMNFDPGASTVPASTARMLNDTSIATALSTHTPLPFAPWTAACYPDSNPETALAESFDGRVHEAMANRWHPLHTAEYIWTRTTFPNVLLRYVGDNIDMVHHVESRTPFLDHHVTEYANGLPPSLKMKYDPATQSFRDKYLLREAMKPFVTAEIYERAKHPYMGPARFAENGPLHAVVRRLVTRENVAKLGFVDWSKTEGLVERAFVDKDAFAFRRAMAVAQFVVLGQRFGVKTAAPEAE